MPIVSPLHQKNPALHEAFKITPSETLVDILQQLCAQEDIVERFCAKRLLVPVSPRITNEGRDAEHIETITAVPGAKRKFQDEQDTGPLKKHKTEVGHRALKEVTNGQEATKPLHRSRWALCAQCDDKFDIWDNNDKACCYHPGRLDMDDDKEPGFWSYGEWCPRAEDDWDTWRYCDADGSAQGCKTGPHREERLQSELDKQDRTDEEEEDDDEDT